MPKKEASTPLAAKIEQGLAASADHRSMTSHRFFFGYLYGLITQAPLYTQWQRLLAYIRRFRTLAFAWRTVTLLWSIVETGALVLLTTAVFLVILPILAALMLGILITARIESKRTNRQLWSASQGKPIYLLFLPLQPSPLLKATAKELAEKGATVLLLSPYWISAKGLSRGGFYCTARKEDEGIYLVRRYYFFSLQKHVLSKANVSYVY